MKLFNTAFQAALHAGDACAPSKRGFPFLMKVEEKLNRYIANDVLDK